MLMKLNLQRFNNEGIALHDDYPSEPRGDTPSSTMTITKGTYVWNDTLTDFPYTDKEMFSIHFICDSNSYYNIFGQTVHGTILWYDNIKVYDTDTITDNVWTNEKYKTIEILEDTSVDTDFYNWFTANTTKQTTGGTTITKGTYKWKDTPSMPTSDTVINFPFKDGYGDTYTQLQMSNVLIKYSLAGTGVNVYSTLNKWTNNLYKTIVVTQDTDILSNYDLLITNGNLVKQTFNYNLDWYLDDTQEGTAIAITSDYELNENNLSLKYYDDNPKKCSLMFDNTIELASYTFDNDLIKNGGDIYVDYVNNSIVVRNYTGDLALVYNASLTKVANAIRSINGSTDSYTPLEMASAIRNLVSGTIDITANSVVDVKQYKWANVNVQGLDTSDATASASKILEGYTAYVNGVKISGSVKTYTGATSVTSLTATLNTSGMYMANNITVNVPVETKTVEPVFGTDVSKVDIIPSQGYTAMTKVTITKNVNLIPQYIMYNRTISGVTGTYTSDGTILASDVLKGKIGYSKGVKITGSMETYSGATTITSNQTLATSGKYLTSNIVVNVPSTQTQEKTVFITSNTTTDIVPDTGKALSKVSVITDVPQLIEVSTSAEMDALLDENNVSLYYLYTGTTDSKYTNGDIYKVQEKPLPQLAKPTNVSISGTTLSWDAVENAESYDILADGVVIGNTTGGATSVSYQLELLEAGDVDSVKVDNVEVIDSLPYDLTKNCTIIVHSKGSTGAPPSVDTIIINNVSYENATISISGEDVSIQAYPDGSMENTVTINFTIE